MTASAAMPATAEVISLSEELVSIRGRPLQQFAREVGEYAFARAGACDEDGAYPAADVAALRELGLITAVFPPEFGGAALSGSSLSEVLQSIGSGSLPLGRLFEGHVNAIELVLRYGDRDQLDLLAREAQEGKLFGVWNTDELKQSAPDPLTRALLARGPKDPGVGRRPYRTSPGDRDRRRGASIDDPAQIEGFRLCRSFGMAGARHARFGDRRRRFHRRRSSSLSKSSAATETTSGNPGFPGAHGALPRCIWAACRDCLIFSAAICRKPTADRILIRRRVSARLRWRPRRRGSGSRAPPRSPNRHSNRERRDQLVAYVNLTRLAVEAAALDLMQLVHRSVGLQAFLRPNPIERISRDLATYLRQPGPDRTLTNAAAWVLAQPQAAQDLWR